MDAYSRHEVVDALDDADPVKAAVLEALEAVGRAYQVAGDAYIA